MINDDMQQLPPGARCELHPTLPAAVVCVRCGGFACTACWTAIAGDRYCIRCADRISPLADPALRLAANLVDLLLGLVPALLIFYGIMLDVSLPTVFAAVSGLVWLLLVIVLNLRWLRLHGQSIGKRAFKLRVVYADGQRMSVGRIVPLRNLVPMAITFVPIVGTLFGLVDQLFIFRQDRRTLHDLLAGSIVITAERARAQE